MSSVSKKRINVITALIVIAAIAVALTAYFVARQNKGEDNMDEYVIVMSIDRWREFTSTELFEKALGDYDWDTGEWRPLTDRLYAFDAEVFDIENMYKLTLLGIQSIASDIVISDVHEDLSGMTDDMEMPTDPFGPLSDGVRSVSFKLNGHEYSLTLKSYGDWLNTDEFFRFMNEALEKEGCVKRLWLLSDGVDQMGAVVYDTAENVYAWVAYREND